MTTSTATVAATVAIALVGLWAEVADLAGKLLIEAGLE